MKRIDCEIIVISCDKIHKFESNRRFFESNHEFFFLVRKI
jgi:hypothetical protein